MKMNQLAEKMGIFVIEAGIHIAEEAECCIYFAQETLPHFDRKYLKYLSHMVNLFP